MVEPYTSPINVRIFSQENINKFSLIGLFKFCDSSQLNLKSNDMCRKRRASFDNEPSSLNFNSHKVKKENDENDDNFADKEEIKNKEADAKKDENGNIGANMTKDSSTDVKIGTDLTNDADINNDTCVINDASGNINNGENELWGDLKDAYSGTAKNICTSTANSLYRLSDNVGNNELSILSKWGETFEYDIYPYSEQKASLCNVQSIDGPSFPIDHPHNADISSLQGVNKQILSSIDFQHGCNNQSMGIRNFHIEEQKSFGLRNIYVTSQSCAPDIEYSKQILPDNSDKIETCKLLLETKFDPGFIDTHCHIDFLFNKNKFKDSFKDFMESCEDSDPFPKSFEGCIAVFCDPLTFKKVDWWEAILNSEKIFGAFGCHPHFSNNFGPEEEEFLDVALKNIKVRAVGEIGLDFSGRNGNSKELQEKVFRKQLEMAKLIGKPIVIHSRDAYPLCLSILKEVVPKNFVIHRHCFTGDYEEAAEWINHFPNCYIGFTCLITQDSMRGRRLRPVVEKIPIQRLLLETDAPYFKPVILGTPGDNSHPGMAIHVAHEIAKLKNMAIEDVLKIIRENTRAVYSI